MSPESKDSQNHLKSLSNNSLRNRKSNEHDKIEENREIDGKINEKLSNDQSDSRKEFTNQDRRDFDLLIQPSNKDPFSLEFKINLPVLSLSIVAFLMRWWYLEHPKSVVFDEIHYAKFVSFYMKRMFYFASEPPLGCQLTALVGWLFDYDGNNNFTRIADDYTDTVPIKALRFIPCLCGSLLVPLTYYIAIELGLKRQYAFIASMFTFLENSFLTQSKFILLDMIVIFFASCGVYLFILFRKSKLFSLQWFAYLTASCTFLACAICVKFVGIIWLALCLTVCLYDYWWLLPNKSISSMKLFTQSLIYFANFIILPFAVYIGVFYIHLNVLTKAGPHDAIMTSAFQASLEGGLSSIIQGQPLEIAHGSQITLKHTLGRACWLHSHPFNYPMLYPDERVSSLQQQVTCYSFKDVNNWWLVKRPNKNFLVPSDLIDVIKHGDVIELVHGMTGRYLNSHDVAAPLSPANQEVSCYIDLNISMPAQNLWKVDLVNKDDTNGIWHTIISEVRLIHLSSSQALRLSGKQYPEWGFNQHEIVTDKKINSPGVIWNVEEHRYLKLSDVEQQEQLQQLERDLISSEFIPLSPTKLGFWHKMKELHYKMLFTDSNLPKDHFYASSFLDLILLNKGIAYWISKDNKSQIYLLGNLYLHYSSLAGIFIFLALLIAYLLRRRRKFYDLNEQEWTKFQSISLICLYGYILHLSPLVFTDKILFYHHYLPAISFKIIILATLLDHLSLYSKRCSLVLSIAILILVSYNFYKFLPFSYAKTQMSPQEVSNLRWKKSWIFLA